MDSLLSQDVEMMAACDNSLNPFQSGPGLFGTLSNPGKSFSTEFISKKKEQVKDAYGFRVL